MPYVSDWMSIPEACAHIGSVEGCDTISAFKQLRSAIRDGKIRTDRQWKTDEQLKVLRRDVLKIWSGPTGEASQPKSARTAQAGLNAGQSEAGLSFAPCVASVPDDISKKMIGEDVIAALPGAKPSRSEGESPEACAPEADGEASKRKGRGKTASPFWRPTEIEAMRWLDYNGCPEPWDGGQTKLEDHIKDWLAERGHQPAESTVRGYVAKWILEFRNRLA